MVGDGPVSGREGVEATTENHLDNQDDVKHLVAGAGTDPEAFAALYDLYVDRVYAFAYRRLGSKADAEDVTAETFLRALNHLGRFTWQGGGFGAWLFRIARNLCWDTLRTRGRSAPLLMDAAGPATTGGSVTASGSAMKRSINPSGQEPHATATDPVEALLERERLDRLRALVAELPDSQYEMILLKYAAGLTNAEIAVATGKSVTAVSSLFSRVTTRLRERFGEGRA